MQNIHIISFKDKNIHIIFFIFHKNNEIKIGAFSICTSTKNFRHYYQCREIIPSSLASG
jgi:hypothetical protein